MIDWVKTQGSQSSKPEEFDSTSSPTTVYQRRNIVQVTQEQEDGSVSTYWEYDERKLTKDEYISLLQESLDQAHADIDYIMAMTDIE